MQNRRQYATFPRSPEMMSSTDTGLLVVDVQQKLVNLIDGHATNRVEHRPLDRRCETAGLASAGDRTISARPGSDDAGIVPQLDRVFDKTAFSCGACAGLCEEMQSLGPRKWLVCGIEAHVCIQQTVLDLLAEGYRIYVAADAIGSRRSKSITKSL